MRADYWIALGFVTFCAAFYLWCELTSRPRGRHSKRRSDLPSDRRNE